MNNIQHFDGPTFEADVLQAAEPVVVDFWAEWCPPCKMMEPAVETLAEEFAGKVKIGKLDVDANPEIAIQYNVMGIPTLGLFRDGKLVDHWTQPSPSGLPCSSFGPAMYPSSDIDM